MSVIIYEHLTSGALTDDAVTANLLREGETMLASICKDLLELNIDITIFRSSQLAKFEYADEVNIISSNSPRVFNQNWQNSLIEHNNFMIIAPETDGCLYQLTKRLTENNKTILGCSNDAILLCSDKYKTFEHLRAHQISTPVTYTADEWFGTEHNHANWIVKPVDGAGSEHTYKYSTSKLSNYLESLLPMTRSSMIVQPFVEGSVFSINLFIEDNNSHLLSINEQFIAIQQDQLHWSGCQSISVPNSLLQQVNELTRQLKSTISGLWGFVGVDIIYYDDVMYIIDINPRLTMGYASINRTNTNPATHLINYLEKHDHVE